MRILRTTLSRSTCSTTVLALSAAGVSDAKPASPAMKHDMPDAAAGAAQAGGDDEGAENRQRDGGCTVVDFGEGDDSRLAGEGGEKPAVLRPAPTAGPVFRTCPTRRQRSDVPRRSLDEMDRGLLAHKTAHDLVRRHRLHDRARRWLEAATPIPSR